MKKILGIMGGVVLLLVVIVAVLVFITPGDFKVEREITINKPKADVFNYVKLVKNQKEWGTWIKKDPAVKLAYSGTDGEPGFITSWDSDNEEVGTGEQEITKVTDGSRIDSQLRFKEPFESRADAYIITEEIGPAETKVKWGFTGSMPKPMNLMLLVMDMDKEVGKDFDEGLRNLKTILEK